MKEYRLGGKITFVKADSQVFEKNLRKVDTVLPEIIEELRLNASEHPNMRNEKIEDKINQIISKLNNI